MSFFQHSLVLALAFALSAALPATAQNAPAPPPPEQDPGSEDQGVDGITDLSAVPVPEADRDDREPALTSAERATTPIQLSVIPVGFVPPPIIYIDQNGMPRERYRDPLEYPPAVYHVATEKGSIRVMAAQNQLGPTTRVPRLARIALSYEIPPGDDEVASEGDGPARKRIGDFPVPAGATHLAVVLWKDHGERLWKQPEFRVIDISPGKVKRNEVVVVNASARELAVHRGDAPVKVRAGFMGSIALGVDGSGRLPVVVAASNGADWHPLSRTVIGPGRDERLFLVAWDAPPSPAQPAGVAVTTLSKRLMPARPFADPRD